MKPTCIKKLNAFLGIAKISNVVKIRTYWLVNQLNVRKRLVNGGVLARNQIQFSIYGSC
jgi:hypothetical protein